MSDAYSDLDRPVDRLQSLAMNGAITERTPPFARAGKVDWVVISFYFPFQTGKRNRYTIPASQMLILPEEENCRE